MKKLSFFFVLLFSLSCSTYSSAQQLGWHFYKEPPLNVTPRQIEIANDGTLYMLTTNRKIYYREPNDEWTLVQGVQPFWNHDVIGINPVNKRLFVGTNQQGIHYTDDFGASWGLEYFFTNPVTGFHGSVGAIGYHPSSGTILLGGGLNVSTLETENYRSTNNGNSWTTVTAPNSFNEFFYLENNTVIANLFFDGIYQSTDDGITWSFLSLLGKRILDFAQDNDGILYAAVYETNDGTETGIYRSADQGSTWEIINTGLNNTVALCVNYSLALNKVVCGTQTGIYQFENNEWLNISNNLDAFPINDIAVHGDDIYLATRYNGVVKKSGNQWIDFNEGFSGGVSNIVFNNQNQLLSIFDNSAFVSSNSNISESWTNYNLSEVSNNVGQAKKLVKNTAGVIFVMDFNELYRSTNGGASFINLNVDIPLSNGALYTYYEDLYISPSGEILLYQFNDNHLYHSTNNGESFEEVLGVPEIALSTEFPEVPILLKDFVVTNAGQYYLVVLDVSAGLSLYTSNGNGNWEEINFSSLQANPTDVELDVINNQILVSINTQPYWLDTENNTFSPLEAPWITSNPNVNYTFIAHQNEDWFAILYPVFSEITTEGIWRSTDQGLTWENLGFPTSESNDPFYVNCATLNQQAVPFVPVAFGDGKGVYYFGEEDAFSGIGEITLKNNPLIVYPNPLIKEHQLFIEAPLINSNTKLIIIDSQGKLVHNKYQIDGFTISINLRVDAGWYSIQLVNNGVLIGSQRILVQ